MKTLLKCILITAILLVCVQTVNAHGLIYETRDVDDKTLKITLKWSSGESSKGIEVEYFYLKNGKILNIGYETKEGAPSSVSMDYDLSSAIPPIRINLININNVDWLPFSDIDNIEQKEYIKHLHDTGVITGMPDGKFYPESFISRAEFSVIMVKALGLEGTAENDGRCFTDIGQSWAKNEILLATDYGILSGYDDKTFKPDNPLTVAEACTAVCRSFNFKTVKNGIYDRLKTGMWYSGYVKRIFDAGILNTDDSIYNAFNEQDHIKRADCAMMISRALSTY